MADSKQPKAYLSAKQANWFAKVRKGLEQETGKTLDEWIEIARGCPETTHKKRLLWLKKGHGLGNNRASTVLSAAFESDLSWDKSGALLDALWKNPELRDIYDAIEAIALSLGEDVVVGPRNSFAGFSRNYQFAAARPVGGKVRLGLALDPTEFNLEESKKSDSWSSRLKSVVIVSNIDDVNDDLKARLKTAWESS